MVYGNGTEANRDARSRELAERQDPPGQHWRPAHLEQRDLQLGDSMSVSHFGPQWGVTEPQRRHHRVMGLKTNPGDRSVSVLLRDEREALLNGAWLRFSFENQSEYRDGMFSVMPHPNFSYWTSGVGMVEDPFDGAIARQLSRPYSRAPRPKQARLSATRSGMLLERRCVQNNYRSAYVSGTTGLVAVTPGANPSTFAAVTALNVRMPFRWTQPGDSSTWTPTVIEITAAASSPTGGGYSHPASKTITAGDVTCVAIDHHDDPAAVLGWVLARAVDGWYWNDSTGAWQAGVVGNLLAVASSDWARQHSKPVTGPPSNTTYTLSIIQPTGGTPSRTNRVACAEIYNLAWPHSRIVIDDGSATDPNPYGFSDDDVLVLTNDVAARLWLSTRGTFLFRFIPNWTSTQIATLGYVFYAVLVYYDANNKVELYYTADTYQWHLKRTTAGVATTASVTMVMLEGYEFTLAVRWASPTADAGELDELYGSAGAGIYLQNFDLSVYDTSGNVARANAVNAHPTETDVSRIELGGDSAGNSLDGGLIEVGWTRYVLSNAELDALCLQTVQVWFP